MWMARIVGWAVVALLVLAGLLLIADSAKATHPHQCYDYEAYVTKVLQGQYKEARRGEGMYNDRYLTELWVSERGETYTLIVVNPTTEQTCIIAAGTDWQEIRGVYGQRTDLR